MKNITKMADFCHISAAIYDYNETMIKKVIQITIG